MAYRNKANGFYSNHHVTTGSTFYNNTAYRNSTNFNMLSQKIMKSPYTATDTSVDCPGFNHVLHNNLSFRTSKDTSNLGSCNITYNSFSPGSGVLVDASDFLSTDEALLVAPRATDGSLPVTDFLRLKATSDLLNKGMNLGFAFSGSAPDFGAFEYQYPIALVETNTEPSSNLTAVTDPKGRHYLQFSLQQPSCIDIRIFDNLGRVVYRSKPTFMDMGEHTQELNCAQLRKGIYIACVKTSQGIRSIKLSL
jgi:hypothetical protein